MSVNERSESYCGYAAEKSTCIHADDAPSSVLPKAECMLMQGSSSTD